MRYFLVLAALLCLPLPAAAQDYDTILDIPPGQTLVGLSATERVEVDQDLLIAELRYEAENASPKALQDEINAKMKAALDVAQKVKSVKTSTQQYYVYEYDPTQGKPLQGRQKLWRGQQGLTLKGKQADELLDLTGKLQEMGLSMNGLTYAVSPELLEETRNSLLDVTLEKLKTKAQRTAKALGKSSADLVQVQVDTDGGYYPQPAMMRGMAMDSGMAKMEMAAPVAAPGQSEITLTVSAQALLKP